MYDAIIFTMKDGLPAASRMIRFSASWHRSEIMPARHAGHDAPGTLRRRRRCPGVARPRDNVCCRYVPGHRGR